MILLAPVTLAGCSSTSTGVIQGNAVPCIGVGSAKPIHFTVSLLTGDLDSSSVRVASQSLIAEKKNQWRPSYLLRVPAGEYTLISSPNGPATGVARGAPIFAKVKLTRQALSSPPFASGRESWGSSAVAPVYVHANRTTRIDAPQC
jgi:hypothetical protein